MSAVRFNVLNTAIYLEDEKFDAGENEVEKPSKDLLRLLNHAHAAGVVELEGADPGAYGVQSQEEGEAANAAAVADGSWGESNAAQATEDAEARETYIDIDVQPVTEEEE
jgi:hypothetical protein